MPMIAPVLSRCDVATASADAELLPLFASFPDEAVGPLALLLKVLPVVSVDPPVVSVDPPVDSLKLVAVAA